MSTTKAEESAGAAIPTWLIVLVVAAVAFVLWRVVASVAAARSTAPVTRNVAPAQVINPAPTGTERHKMHEEK